MKIDEDEAELEEEFIWNGFKSRKNLDTLYGLHKEYKLIYIRAKRATMDRELTPDEAVKLSNILDKIHKIREHVEIAQHIREWQKQKNAMKKISKSK